MKITQVIWLKQFSEKIERKHLINRDEVEQVIRNQPRFEFGERGDIHGEDLYKAIGQTDAGRYLIVFFIYKRRGQSLIISARDASKGERKSYGKKKD